MPRRNEAAEIIVGLEGKAVKRGQPRWIPPMLATLSATPFFDRAWIYEHKLDGIRCLTHKRGEEVELYSRNRNSLNARYPGIVEGLRRQPAERFILDGEIVACDGGHCGFGLLQGRSRGGGAGIDIFYYVFDILYFEGYDLTAAPLTGRKLLLEKALSYQDPVRYLAAIPEADEAYLLEACREGREGLLAKRADSPYTPQRSAAWLKFKCVNEQEFVIGGYTDPRGSRSGLGALLVGYYEDESLHYAGKVGTGFSEKTLEELHTRLSRLQRKRPPFVDDMKGVHAHWVRPELVAQVGFAEWTRDGRLRHPRFLGLRSDKDPGQVRREMAAP